MDVACFCGCRFSCARDVGTCPVCGEYATLSRVSAAEEKQRRADLELLLSCGAAAGSSRMQRAGEA
jgi:predicted ATP-dependent serine protease